jgi:hypothetical protein
MHLEENIMGRRRRYRNECAACGGEVDGGMYPIHDEEEMPMYCESCGEAICSDCKRECIQCEAEICPICENGTQCTECGEYFCEDCSDSLTSCPVCEEHVCSDCVSNHVHQEKQSEKQTTTS